MSNSETAAAGCTALVVKDRLTKQLRPIPACNAHKFLLASGMVWQVMREIVHLAAERGPCVLSGPVFLEH